jgi:hypothetical protein
MKLDKLAVLVFVFIIFNGCASISSTKLNYDNSNPVKIEQSISGLDLTPLLQGKVVKNDLIVVRSIESVTSAEDYFLDSGVKYVIEDNLITSLLNMGYRVGERDPDIMFELSRESTEKYNLSNLSFRSSGKRKTEEAKAPEGATINNFYYGDMSSNTLSKSNASINEENIKEVIETDLMAATKLLTYRVLECGINYSKIELDLNNINRHAKTRLHCRLEDTKSGEIISSGIVENELIDKIDESKLKDLEEFHYYFYDHGLPNAGSLNNQVDNKNNEVLSSIPGANPNAVKFWGYLIAGTFILLISI